MRPLLLALGLLTALAVQAEDTPPFKPVPPPPPLPDEVPPSEAELEPEVTIRRQGEEVIEEYRVNGQLFMIKITPSKGYPYYLIDTDGDGSLETHRNDLENPEVNMWRLLTW